MKSIKTTVFDALLYLLTYAVIELVVSGVVMYFMKDSEQSLSLLISLAIVNAVVIAAFGLTKWTPLSANYLRERHWDAIAWAFLMPIGLLFPLNLIQDVLPFSLPDSLEEMSRMVTASQWSIVVIGFIAPIAEEMVFRGAILRCLLKHARTADEHDDKKRKRKVAIAVIVSALIFGLVHIYPAQMVNATIMGLLLGYVYVRTDSILPCIVLHCANNIIICLIEYALPGIDYMTMHQLAGSYLRMALYLFFSLCVFVPALIQFHKASAR